jgi:hypothetical protein
MQTDRKIFEIRTSTEESRPEIDYELQENAIDWGLVGQCLDGRRPIEDYQIIDISVQDDKATEWDYYSCPGTFGLFSSRAVNTLGENVFKNYRLIPARINGADYFFLKCLEMLDYLDREKSVYEAFDDDPNRFITISKFSFNWEKIDQTYIFTLPEYGRIFCLEPNAGVIRNQLKGFRLLELP